MITSLRVGAGRHHPRAAAGFAAAAAPGGPRRTWSPCRSSGWASRSRCSRSPSSTSTPRSPACSTAPSRCSRRIFGLLFFGRRTTGPQLLGLGVGLVGVVLISLPSLSEGSSQALGVGLVLLATLCYGLATNLAAPLQARYGSRGVMARMLALATIWTLPFGLVSLPDSHVELAPAARGARARRRRHRRRLPADGLARRAASAPPARRSSPTSSRSCRSSSASSSRTTTSPPSPSSASPSSSPAPLLAGKQERT